MEALPRLRARAFAVACAAAGVLATSAAAQETDWFEGVLGGDPPRRTERGVAWFTSSELSPAQPGDEVRLGHGEWIEAPLAVPLAASPGRAQARLEVDVAGIGFLVARVVDPLGVCCELQQMRAGTGTGVRAQGPAAAESERALVPRAHVRIEAWLGTLVLRRVSVKVAWPRVSEEALRAQVERELLFLAPAIDAARDADGTRPTSFLTRRIDPSNGKVLEHIAAGHHPYFDALLLLHAATPRPALEARVRQQLCDLVQHGWNARTGLPQLWDGANDRALRARPVDPRGAVAFAIACLRELELSASERTAIQQRLARAARTLRDAQAPDGSWPAVYVPETGAPAAEAPQIRALRSARLVAEIEAACGAEPDARAALACLEALELEWHWPGTPERPDPGFDDAFGLLGADAAALHRLTGAEPFARFFREAAARYEELWLRSREAGGSNAPDQVRAMLLLLDEAPDPEARTRRLALAWESFRDLARSTQLDDGRFADVTAVRFEPRLHLPVGDIQGVPFHLLRLGARLLREKDLRESAREELRAVLAQALLALEPRRGTHGFGRGASGASDTGRLFQVLAELH